jgi:hypothetical protein
MVLYPIPPGGGRRRAGSRSDWRISADFDPIAAGPGQGTRICDPPPGIAYLGRQAAGSGQRAAVPGRSIACRAAGRMFCLRAGQAGSGQEKTPGREPRGVVRGQRPGLAMRISVGLDPKPHVAPRHHDAVIKRCAARGATPSQIGRLRVAVPVAMVNAEQCDALGAS